MKAFDPIYKRNQVEFALWQTFRTLSQKNLTSPVVTTFNHRIKRLLDLDKTLVESAETVESAFLTELHLGQGNDRKFSYYDAFLLGLGLQLMDSGYSQGDVIFALQHLRSGIKPSFIHVTSYSTTGRTGSQKDTPAAPLLAKNKKTADLRAFIIFQRAELKEVHEFKLPNNRPVFFKPTVAFGTSELFDYLEENSFCFQTHLIIEFSYQARVLREKLLDAPLSTRGIKPRKDNQQ